MGIMKVKTTSEPVAENEVGAIKGLLLLGVCMAYSAVLFTAFAVVQVVCPRLLLKTSQLIGYSPEDKKTYPTKKLRSSPSHALLSRQG